MGDLESFQLLSSLNFPWDIHIFYYAIEHEHTNIIQWFISREIPESWKEKACLVASQSDSLVALIFIRTQDEPFPWDENVSHAALNCCNIDMLVWMREQDDPCPFDEELFIIAIRNNDLDVLHWLRSEGCPWSERVFVAAAKNTKHQEGDNTHLICMRGF